MKKRYVAGTVFIAGIWIIISLLCWFKPSSETSVSERRKLAQFPEFNKDTVLSGNFMTDFEKYTLDQFPARDNLRTLKSLNTFYILNQSDNNKLYIKNGYISKIEYPYKESQIKYAVSKFENIYKTYLKDTDVKIYTSVIPDKGYFLAEQNGYPSLEYSKLFSYVKNNMYFSEYIDISDTLTISDYYKTDTHWKQEKIIGTAQKISKAMGTDLPSEYKKTVLAEPFYGVYYGQSALPLKSERITILSNDIMDSCKTFNAETGKAAELYDMDKLKSRDLYDVYLSGAVSVITIENPMAESERELVIFRDSFGSSIAPLLSQGYSKVTLLDIRYIPSSYIGEYVNFDNQDVLFLYSTLVLNNSSILK